jgi:hypothetical protein
VDLKRGEYQPTSYFMPQDIGIEMGRQSTEPSVSDALVFFGATGDLAYKKIFPALHNMVRHGTLTIPIIGVAKSGWTLDQLRDRARDSIQEFGGGLDSAAFARMLGLLQYLDGDAPLRFFFMYFVIRRSLRSFCRNCGNHVTA